MNTIISLYITEFIKLFHDIRPWPFRAIMADNINMPGAAVPKEGNI